jgi:hypothetical protein
LEGENARPSQAFVGDFREEHQCSAHRRINVAAMPKALRALVSHAQGLDPFSSVMPQKRRFLMQFERRSTTFAASAGAIA